MVKPLLALAAVSLVLLVGCQKDHQPKTAEQASAKPMLDAPHKKLTLEDIDPSRSSTATMASKVYAQLGVEKKSRPKVSLPAERVVAAFHDAGIETEALKQGLGEPIEAGYCALGHTKKGVGFTVCEYASDTLAKEGKALSEARYNGALGRKLFVNGQTLLIVRAGSGAEAATEAAAMAASFQGLK